jgi:tetratricopeptide (TPR) repeat protein
MNPSPPGSVIVSGPGGIGVAGDATNCTFVTQVVNSASTTPAPAEIAPPRLILLPFSPLKEFIGRLHLLQTLAQELIRDGLRASQPVAIHSTGGVGKTALAVELGWRLYESKRFDYVFLLNATSRQTLDESLAGLCDPIVPSQVGPNVPADLAARRAAVLRWLQITTNASRTLLILDNADSPEAGQTVRDLIPQVPHCAKLITSRYAVWDDVRDHELPLFTREEAQQFLSIRLNPLLLKTPGAQAALEEIAEAVDHLPLALELVCSYLRKKRLSPSEWLNEWKNKPELTVGFQEARIRYRHQENQYPYSLEYVWEQSVSQLDPNSRTVLHLLAWLAAQPAVFPLALLKKRQDWATLNEHLSELADASLINWRPDLEEISIHRILQAVTRYRLSNDEKFASVAVLALLLVEAAPDPNWNPAGWRLWEQLAPHVRTLLSHIEGNFSGSAVEVPTLMSQFALWLYHRTQYAEAESLLRRAINIEEKNQAAAGSEIVIGSGYHERVKGNMATYLVNLALVLEATNRLTEAEPLIRAALAIHEQNVQTEDRVMVHPLNNLGTVMFQLGRLSEAEAFFRRALAIDENSAESASNLASVLKANYRLTEAEFFCRRAFLIAERSLGPDHPGLAAALNNLADLLLETDRLAEAEPLLLRARAIIEGSLGADHPSLATILINLGMLSQVKHSTEAEPLYHRALEIVETSLGPDHPKVAEVLRKLAGLADANGDWNEAETLYRRVLSIDEAAFGPDHPKLAMDLNNLAELLRTHNHFMESESLFRRAVKIDDERLGPQHPETAFTRHNLARLLHQMNRMPEAELLYRDSLTILQTIEPAKHSELVICLESLAKLLWDTDRLGEAEALTRQALAINETNLRADHPEVAKNLNLLSGILRQTGRHNQGTQLLRRAYKILVTYQRRNGHEHPYFPAVNHNYLQALREKGLSEKAALEKMRKVMLE